jgi:LacI family transcriptional regulator
MTRSISVKDVAALAGVSLGTVSNVLNHPDAVSEVTRQRVLTAMDDLGFVRNESARMLRARRSRVIAMVALDLGNPFFTDVARGAEAAAEEHGLSLVLAHNEDRPDKEQRVLRLFEEQRVAGVLITPAADSTQRLRQLAKRGTPVVLVDHTDPSFRHCSVVVRDQLGGRLVGQHLASAAHKRLAFVGGPISLPQVQHRLEGFRESAGDVLVLDVTAPTVNEGRRAGEQLEALGPRRRPTAVFCANDLLALGVLQAFTTHGIRVPDEVALVGYDDIEYAAAAAVPLSSVRQPREQLGRSAVELLLEEISGFPHVHREVVFDPELVVRTSSRHPRRG